MYLLGLLYNLWVRRREEKLTYFSNFVFHFTCLNMYFGGFQGTLKIAVVKSLLDTLKIWIYSVHFWQKQHEIFSLCKMLWHHSDKDCLDLLWLRSCSLSTVHSIKCSCASAQFSSWPLAFHLEISLCDSVAFSKALTKNIY